MTDLLPGSTFCVRAAPNAQGGSSAGRLVAKWDYWLLWRWLREQAKLYHVWAAEKMAVLKKQRADGHPGYSHVLEYLGNGWWAECGAKGVSVNGTDQVQILRYWCHGAAAVYYQPWTKRMVVPELFSRKLLPRGDLFPPARPLSAEEQQRLWQWWESHVGDGYGYGHLARMRWLAGLCRWLPVDLTRYKLTGSGMVCSTAKAKASSYAGRKLWPQLSDDVPGPMLIAYSPEMDWEHAQWNVELPA